ncbi:type II secretion system protein GspG [Humisphaera borealis]|uniref:Type II secretion system protein GspG n=2 Tax=Humisphaera borealis TaxID=2807512 RepID=A0A7M2WPV5_9BACT|nr:type II secretion system protein GspG [Humisphaera borealis]
MGVPLAYSNEKRRTKPLSCLSWMLISVLFLLALCILFVPRYFNSSNTEEKKHAVANLFLRRCANAIERFRVDVGRYPNEDEGLSSLVAAPAAISSRWRGPYLDELPRDPWSGCYSYRTSHNDGRISIVSYGEDGVPSADDLKFFGPSP